MPPLSPRHAAVLADAKTAYARGDAETARRLAREVVGKSAPIDALITLAAAELALGNHSEAHRFAARALTTRPDAPPEAHAVLISALRDLQRLNDASLAADAALERHPEAERLINLRAEIDMMLGDNAAALGRLSPMIDRGPALPQTRINAARASRRLGEPGRGVEILHAFIDGQRPHGKPAMMAEFELGHCLDALGRFDEAFDAFARANERSASRFDPDAHALLADRVIEGWSAEAVAHAPRARTRSDRPVLIIGMFRSGTTLLEQILSCHPSVAAGGELEALASITQKINADESSAGAVMTDPARLTPGAVDRAARSYERAIRRIDSSAERVTDKMPHNWWRLGVAAAALPGARVIRCVREPLDTCLSCFMQDFVNNAFASSLENLAQTYLDHTRVVEHFRRVLDLPFLEVRYEDLVTEQERETRRVLDFLDLPFEAACLRFHESKRVALTASNDQVNRPMYASSIGRWRNYAERLRPLAERLSIDVS